LHGGGVPPPMESVSHEAGPAPGPPAPSDARGHWGLRAKLLGLLLAFGAIPLAVAIGVGYTVSRVIITSQVEQALRELAAGQALHVSTELSRERLLLRTIAGQLPASAPALRRSARLTLARLLQQSLPEGGVFDALRIVQPHGAILASVVLRNTAPPWPPEAPAANWTDTRVVVQRGAAGEIAYLLAVPVGQPTVTAWLEGHVRGEDFRHVFAMPEHVMGGATTAILERGGLSVYGAGALAGDTALSGTVHARLTSEHVARMRIRGQPTLLAIAPIAHTDWVLAALLPEDVALASLSRLRNSALIGAVALVAAILIIATLAARSVTTPLRALADAAREFGRGGRYQPVTAQGTGEVAGLVAAFDRMAADLERSRDEIHRLHAEELQRAQQLASVGELASGVAHEIRNPLTGVRGALDLALRKLPAGEAAWPLLEEAQRQLDRIEQATKQLLRYARPPEMRRLAIDVRELVGRAAAVVGPRVDAAGITLRTEVDPQPVVARVDPELLVQVLVNLMLNAIDAMGRGGDLTVWTARHAPEVWIGVRDTGPGVPPELRREIFRPFFTTKHQGSGLGVSISRQIVARHGGTLRLEDTPGGGATFIVALPLPDGAGGAP
jgi:signal transduction histidine kinase